MHVSPQSGFGGDLAPIRIPSVIPLFPLPNVVFFPRNFLLSREDGVALANFLKQPVDDETLVYNLSFALDFTPLEKQFLLEADSLAQQARRLVDLLQFKHYERNESIGWG